jgi:ATP-binding cassette, subfamily B, bacterial
MQPIFRIIKFTKQYAPWYIFMGIFVIIVSLLSLVGPYITKLIVDAIVGQFNGKQANESYIVMLLAIYLGGDVTITTLTAIGQWIGDLLSVKLQTFLSKRFYKHVLSLHIGYFDNEITGQIVNKLYRGITSITEFIQNMLNNFLPFFLTAFITIILLAHYSPFIAVLLAILFPIYILISSSSSKSWMGYEEKKNTIIDASQGRVFESFVGVRVVKSFAAEAAELAAFLKDRLTVEHLARKQTKQWHIYDFVRRFMLNIILFGIFAYIIFWTFHRQYTLGEMTFLLQLVQQARFPLFAMSFILEQIQQASAGSADYFKVLETQTKIHDNPGAKTIHISKYKDHDPFIKFNAIDFTYEESGHHVLHDISFTIYRGDKFALVGESGQGKSTIVNLLLRYYEPQKGTITVCNQNIQNVTEESLHNHIAVVFQESLLFSGSIKENIRYGKPDATDEEVIRAAKAANAHEFIMGLSEQYNSPIGERGVKLSGGQKQRISIARAMIKNAPIIILDEATSSLDSKSEIEVQKGLEELLKGRTAIIIAHRLSTIATATHILVLANGRVAQYGSHEDLLRNKRGMYAQLVELQASLLKAPSEVTKKKLQSFDLVG